MAATLKKGSRGEDVKMLQRLLGMTAVDGVFGVNTENAVKEFQRSHGLVADGIVGAKTWNILLSLNTKPTTSGLKKSKRFINKIIVHCTDSPSTLDVGVKQVREWHTLPPPKGRGWSDIGYHYLVRLNGNVEVGRDVDIQGAHCSKNNGNVASIGVVYVGGDGGKDTRNEKQKASLLKLLKDLKSLYPNAKIYGHHDFDQGKSCPNFDAKNEYKNI